MSGPLAQLARALPWHGRGQGFESLKVHHFAPRFNLGASRCTAHIKLIKYNKHKIGEVVPRGVLTEWGRKMYVLYLYIAEQKG